METSRQPGMLEGLSRFLVQHERCGAGFDVAHPAGLGSGRVSITCRGCGARHEYATATIEFEREVRIHPGEPQTEARTGEQRPRIPPRPAPYPDSEREPAPEPASPRAEVEQPQARRQLPEASGAGPVGADDGAAARRGFWSSPRTTVALLAVAVIAIVIAVLQLLDNGNGGTQGSGAQSTPTATSAPPQPGPGPAAEPTPPSPTRSLRTSLFRLELPRGWSSRNVGGSLLLEPGDGGRVNVQIYFQSSPSLSESLMARKTAGFLRREVPGASIYPRRVMIAGRSVQELTARGPGETAIAVNVLRGPYRYLLVRRIFAGAKPYLSHAAGQVVRSFRLN